MYIKNAVFGPACAGPFLFSFLILKYIHHHRERDCMCRDKGQDAGVDYITIEGMVQ